jgi:hypothetical protein
LLGAEGEGKEIAVAGAGGDVGEAGRGQGGTKAITFGVGNAGAEDDIDYPGQAVGGPVRADKDFVQDWVGTESLGSLQRWAVERSAEQEEAMAAHGDRERSELMKPARDGVGVRIGRVPARPDFESLHARGRR